MPDIRTSIDDEDGRYRAVIEVEVPGNPEQIWTLIASGPGIETWFVPADLDQRLGGRLVTYHGQYGASEGVITAWEPPHRIAYDEADWQGPDTPVPTWNTEIVVEAISGDTCVVRLSSGFLAGGDDWHDDVDQTIEGWTGALRNLHLYLTHFAGLQVTTLLVQHELPDLEEQPDAAAASGLRTGGIGDYVATIPPAPPLSGVVEHADDEAIIVRTTEPTAGIAEVATSHYGGVTSVVVRWYLYGDDGPATRDREEPAWSAWAASLDAESS